MHEALARANFARDVENLSPVFLNNRGWTLNACEFPLLDVTFNTALPLRLKLRCDEWDDVPPSVELLQENGAAWVGPSRGPTFHQDQHHLTGKPFICMVGSREYHTHQSHVSDLWAHYRAQDGMGLVGLLDRFSRAWRKEMQL